MEKRILLIGTRKGHNAEKNKDWYRIDYVDIERNSNVTEFTNLETYNKLAPKATGFPYKEVKGIIEINEYNRGYLADIK